MNSKWKEASLINDGKRYSADFLLPAAGYRSADSHSISLQ
jgi:hypothetical protein